MSAAAVIGGYGADLVLGDPARAHPVAGFGAIAGRAERLAFKPSRRRGAAYAASLVALAAVGGRVLEHVLGRRPALALTLWAALGGRSLARTATEIAQSLEDGDLERARRRLPALAGRDPHDLDAAQISRAVVESLAENTADAVVGALLWGAVAGAPGVAAYRAANTLDAMVGHRSPRYERFGWGAARLDDVLGWPGARATALLAVAAAPAVAGSPAAAWEVLCADGHRHPSPNAGRAEAAFAGALGVGLGGTLAYDGRAQERPCLNGGGNVPGPADIRRASRLSIAVGAVAACLAAVVAGAVR